VPKITDGHPQRHTRLLHHRIHEGFINPRQERDTEHALPPDDADLSLHTIVQVGDERDHAGLDEVDGVNRGIRPIELLPTFENQRIAFRQ
jgi:hypothetical protein